MSQAMTQPQPKDQYCLRGASRSTRPLLYPLTRQFFKSRMLSAWKVTETEARFRISFIRNGVGMFSPEKETYTGSQRQGRQHRVVCDNTRGQLQKPVLLAAACQSEHPQRFPRSLQGPWQGPENRNS